MPYVRPSVVCAGVAVTEFTDRGEVPYVFFPLNIDVVVPFFWTGKVDLISRFGKYIQPFVPGITGGQYAVKNSKANVSAIGYGFGVAYT